MLLPLYRTCRVSRPNRFPWHTGQVTQTSARKSISSLFDPLPSQASHRPPRDVKAKPAWRVAACFRLGHPREEVANLVEQLDIGCRIRARSPTNRRLVDINHLVEMLEPLDPIVRAWLRDRSVQVARQCLAKNVSHQRAFTRTRDARHTDKKP